MTSRPPTSIARGLALPAVAALASLASAQVSAGHARRRCDRRLSEERRRIACDLHDGIAQDLAYLAMQSDALAARPGAPAAAADMALAARRALGGTRAAIDVLRGPASEPLAEAIARAADHAATRWGTTVHADVDPGVELPGPTREALLGIVAEATHNAARHGRPETVHVQLRADPVLRLCIQDDGVGFDPAEVDGRPGHHGITGMRERAEAVGGELEIRSSGGAGTQVVVMLA